MEIKLSPEVEAVVERDMATGRFRSVNDYLAEAVGLLHERELDRGETLEAFNAKLDESIAQAERGELLDEAEVRRRIGEMKAGWAARQSA